jgi:hypothetical protein
MVTSPKSLNTQETIRNRLPRAGFNHGMGCVAADIQGQVWIVFHITGNDYTVKSLFLCPLKEN